MGTMLGAVNGSCDRNKTICYVFDCVNTFERDSGESKRKRGGGGEVREKKKDRRRKEKPYS